MWQWSSLFNNSSTSQSRFLLLDSLEDSLVVTISASRISRLATSERLLAPTVRSLEPAEPIGALHGLKARQTRLSLLDLRG